MEKPNMFVENYIKKIEDKSLNIGIIGMGYVGLPLAVEFSKYGFNVTGFDVNDSKVASINAGKSHILDVEEGEVSKLVEMNRLSATTDFTKISEMDALSICVPTPLTENQEPDTSYIEVIVQEIIKYQTRPQLIVLESTTYPGTTKELIADKLDFANRNVDKDYFLCFSPERVDPGNKNYKTKQIPKVIGGITPSSTLLGTKLYDLVIDKVIPVSSPDTAEMSKLIENTFRSINIAFVNEMALMCDRMGIDIWETIDAAATKPFGYMPFYPGPGVGGHCIPLDPMYLYWKGKKDNFFNQFIELSQRINLNMPHKVVDKVRQVLDIQGKALSKANVLIVGVSYKDNIDDIREAPSLDIYEILRKSGTKIDMLDPFVSQFENSQQELVKIFQNQDIVEYSAYDIILILSNHESIDYNRILDEAVSVVDMKHVWTNSHSKVFRIGGGIHG